MRTMLVRSGSGLLSCHGCVGSPRALLAVLRARLQQEDGPGSVVTMTLNEPRASRDEPRTLRAHMNSLAPRLAQRQDGVGVVHALDLVAGAVALAARRTTGVPVVVRAQPAARPRGARSGEAAWAAVLRGADVVMVPTVSDARAAQAAGVRPERIEVSPDGALVAGAQSEALDSPPAVSAAPSADPFLLAVSGVPGSPAIREGLVGALARTGSLRLVIAGCGGPSSPDRSALRELAERHGTADRLELLEHVPDDHLVELVDAACAVVTTRSDPSSGLAALLAMHRARPVVGVRSVTAADVLVEGVTGRLVPPSEPHQLADVLCDAASDSFRRLAWGLAGLDRVKTRYNRDMVFESVRRAYDRAS